MMVHFKGTLQIPDERGQHNQPNINLLCLRFLSLLKSMQQDLYNVGGSQPPIHLFCTLTSKVNLIGQLFRFLSLNSAIFCTAQTGSQSANKTNVQLAFYSSLVICVIEKSFQFLIHICINTLRGIHTSGNTSSNKRVKCKWEGCCEAKNGMTC